ncbi:MAG: hypothetical protein AAB925_00815 [Patescibacteria group bacterium]
MVTEIEEQQVRDFLKRAEVRTMKKDLQKLREVDAVKERDKIANLKTIEEEQIEAAKKQEIIKQKVQQDAEKQKREEILQNSAVKEREAEKDLKKYAEEAEKQQIFLLEAQRLDFENQIQLFEGEKEPLLIRQKNKTLSEIKVQEIKLQNVIEDEKKLENEQKYIEEKEALSNIPSEKKSMEERRGELERQRQEIEKKRWQAEKDLAEFTNKVKITDRELEVLSDEKNSIHRKIKETDETLRIIYSAIMAREEEKRRGGAEQQKIRAAEISKTKAQMNERVQREQWTHSPDSGQAGIIAPVKNKFEAEEEQRKKFMQKVEEQTKNHEQKNN